MWPLPWGDTLRVVNAHLVSTDVDLREAQSEQAKAGWWQSAKLQAQEQPRKWNHPLLVGKPLAFRRMAFGQSLGAIARGLHIG